MGEVLGEIPNGSYSRPQRVFGIDHGGGKTDHEIPRVRLYGHDQAYAGSP